MLCVDVLVIRETNLSQVLGEKKNHQLNIAAVSHPIIDCNSRGVLEKTQRGTKGKEGLSGLILEKRF